LAKLKNTLWREKVNYNEDHMSHASCLALYEEVLPRHFYEITAKLHHQMGELMVQSSLGHPPPFFVVSDRIHVPAVDQ
jgi:hypothetical protein